MRFTGTKETTSAKAEALFVGIAYDLFAYLQDLLAEHGITATYAIGITEGIRLFARQPYHLLFLELNEEHGESSAQLVTALRRARAAPILLLTGTENEESIMKMVRCGVDICVPNAFPPFLIGAYILSMIRRYTDYNRQDRPDSIGDMPMQRGDISIDPLGRTVEVRGLGPGGRVRRRRVRPRVHPAPRHRAKPAGACLHRDSPPVRIPFYRTCCRNLRRVARFCRRIVGFL